MRKFHSCFFILLRVATCTIAFAFQISSSYFEPRVSIPEMSSSPSSSAAGSASTYSDSDSTMSTISSSDSPSTIPCIFDPSTSRRQFFSIPEKIVYYIAKNPTNGETFAKLVQTCKYFYIITPVVVVQKVECRGDKWYAYYGANGENRIEFKYDQPLNFKVWVTQKFICFSGDASQLIPSIYKNDAMVVRLQSEPLELEELLFLAGNAEKLAMNFQLVKYENGDIVQLEDIVKNLPKLKSFTFESDNGDGFNTNTASKLMEIQHIKNFTRLYLGMVPEALNVEQMFNFIVENKHIKVSLIYRHDISDAHEELVEHYSHRLEIEEGCKSRIGHDITLTSQASNLDITLDSFDSIPDVDETEDLLFPWNTEEDEEWELPWDKTD